MYPGIFLYTVYIYIGVHDYTFPRGWIVLFILYKNIWGVLYKFVKNDEWIFEAGY